MHLTPLHPDAPGVIADRAPRTVTTLLVGKLRSRGAVETLCRVRNISMTGMMLETHHTLGYGSWVAVELRSGDRLQGSVVWSSEGRAGVEFAQPIDVDYILAQAKAGLDRFCGPAPRAPRFDVECAARISCFGRYIDVTLENISQSGARIVLPKPPREDTEVILSVPGLPTRRCTTRWAREDKAGLIFLEPISYHDLAPWLEHCQLDS
ncbi:hypothetical protein FHS95_002489 [Sphingomonas naasensis]|uniref:PilZ domain-containing protein n=1 Tax=Sphingomonas naasensis TaxID=1344951 RepID=A0A4S1WJ35_9SPHN|nr:PilZ domain-containing protein [Sphingomonas naasensis]NIJ20797.1 hypothetical protein [Sphingomonas naasensis]TGX43201.1 PilZ domain-containing protein [Sphingomonas naasensis]